MGRLARDDFLGHARQRMSWSDCRLYNEWIYNLQRRTDAILEHVSKAILYAESERYLLFAQKRLDKARTELIALNDHVAAIPFTK